MNYKKVFIIDALFLLFIVFIVFRVTTFEFGKYLFAGDFRIAIYKDIIGNQFLSLVSSKFSNNNFIYLSFYPLFLFFSLIPYAWVVSFIFLGVPILLFQSIKFVVLSFIGDKKIGTLQYLFVSLVSFFYAINPWFINRYVHYTMQYSAIFFPLVIWSLYKYQTNGKLLNKYLLFFFVFFYLGSIGPQPTVVFVLSYFFFVAGIGITKIAEIKRYFLRSLLSFAVVVVSLLHVIYPAFTGHAVTRSFLESLTNANVLLSLGRNSNILTAISGTNFFEKLIVFPTNLSVGMILFLSVLIMFPFAKKRALNYIFMSYLLLLLIVTSGYRAFKPLYDFLIATPLSNYLWLLKDPNTYYLFFLFPLILLFFLLIKELKIKQWQVMCLVVVIFIGNVLFIFNSDYSNYKKYFKFISLPSEYKMLSEGLKNDSGRNLWIPSSQYIGKNFSVGQTHFPSPSIWLTQNGESTYYATEYRLLNKIIEDEMIINNCKNRDFLNWIISAQHLNIILDKNSVNNSLLEDSTTEEYIRRFEKCLSELKNVYKFKTFGKIEVYKSNLKLIDKYFAISGDIHYLNNFIGKNPVNVIFTPSIKEASQELSGRFSILNESYDSNWRSNSGEKSIGKVNFASMLFPKSSGDFHYKDAIIFRIITLVQTILLVMCVTTLLFIELSQKKKK